MREARNLFPATTSVTYFNSAAVGLASEVTASAIRSFVDEWVESGLDFVRGEAAADSARGRFATLIGADSADVALIPSVSSAAGLVASQFGPSSPGQNLVIGEREYSSNHFPWRLLAEKGYEIRQVPFRNGGMEADDVAQHIDSATQLVAFSAVQTATGFRADISGISAVARAAGALVYVDGAQWIGAMPVAQELAAIDILSCPDHKFLMNAGRGMGFCYLSPQTQARFTPTGAGWRAGTVPMESFFGPEMNLSPTASRFDQSVSWAAAVAIDAALSVFETFGAETIFHRNAELASLLRRSVADVGWQPIELPAERQSTIVSIPIRNAEPAEVVARLREQRITSAARDGHLRLAVHFYNHEDDIASVAGALRDL